MAAELGLAGHGPRCHACDLPCDFRLDLAADPALKAIYLDAERADGYLRDRCVFDADIDIEDTAQALVGYAGGASATYTLCAYAPWEGLEITFFGTRGELTTGTSRCTASSADSATSPTATGWHRTQSPEKSPRRSRSGRDRATMAAPIL